MNTGYIGATVERVHMRQKFYLFRNQIEFFDDGKCLFVGPLDIFKRLYPEPFIWLWATNNICYRPD